MISNCDLTSHDLASHDLASHTIDITLCDSLKNDVEGTINFISRHNSTIPEMYLIVCTSTVVSFLLFKGTIKLNGQFLLQGKKLELKQIHINRSIIFDRCVTFDASKNL